MYHLFAIIKRNKIHIKNINIKEILYKPYYNIIEREMIQAEFESIFIPFSLDEHSLIFF